VRERIRSLPDTTKFTLLLHLMVVLSASLSILSCHLRGSKTGLVITAREFVISFAISIGFAALAVAVILVRTMLLRIRSNNRAVKAHPENVQKLDAVWMWVAIPVVALFILSGLFYVRQGVYTVVGDLGLNVAAAVVVALGGWFIFRWAFVTLARRDLLSHQRQQLEEEKELNRPTGQRPNQAQAVVGRLRDDHSIFLASPTTDAPESFIGDLKEKLHQKDTFALVITPDRREVDLLDLGRSRFRAALQSAGVSAPPLVQAQQWDARVFETLARRRRLVIIIDKLDSIAQLDGHGQARKFVEEHTDELKGAKVPFIAIVSPASMPAAEKDNCIAITPPGQIDIKEKGDIARNTVLVSGQLADYEDRARRRAVRRMAVTLQRSGLSEKTIDTGQGIDYINDKTSELSDEGAVYFGTRFFVESTCEAFDQTLANRRMAWIFRRIFRRIADRLLITSGQLVRLVDLYDDLRPIERFDLFRCISLLIEERVLSVSSVNGVSMIGFSDPAICEIAIGWFLAVRDEPYTFSQQRTDLCLAAEIAGRVASAVGDSLRLPWAKKPPDLRELDKAAPEWGRAMTCEGRRAALSDQRPPSLPAVGAALSAALAYQYPLELDEDWLDAVWTNSDETQRGSFVSQLTPAATGKLSGFLWRRVTDAKSRCPGAHGIRRSICGILGVNGGHSWGALADQWRAAVNQATGDRSLTWYNKPAEGTWSGHELGSLAWVLPSVVVTVHDNSGPSELLRQLNNLVVPATPRASDPPPDVGLEIALAEGCKDACFVSFERGLPLPATVVQTVRDLLTRSRSLSWATRLIALQARFLMASIGEVSPGDVLNECTHRATDKYEHPLVKRYAQILKDPLTKSVDLYAAVGNYVWRDDVAALSEAGGELIEEVALVLATVALLLNFSGGQEAINTDGVGSSNAEVLRRWDRIKGLTRYTLPLCLEMKSAALNSEKRGCQCEFGLCGKDIYSVPVRRRLSRTFIDRIEQDKAFDTQDWKPLDIAAIRVHLARLRSNLTDQKVDPDKPAKKMGATQE
jgi:hypothetical protein